MMHSPPAARTLIDGRWRDYFAGCGYLGLQGHPAITQAAIQAVQRYGLGAATSRGGFGEHPLYHQLEAAVARFFAAETALTFASGYLGGLLLLQGLRPDYDRIFIDESAHYSLWDAARAAAAPLVPFRHLQADDLSTQLRSHLRPGERPLVLSDGVFPVSGDIAPLPDYAQALSGYEDALLCLDDAHAAGVLGPNGRGTPEHWQQSADLSDLKIIVAATLSKALAGFGGVVAGPAPLVEKLRRRAPAYVGASPAPLPAVAGSTAALTLAAAEPERRRRLRQNIAQARAGLRHLGWPLAATDVPILCLPRREGLDLARIQQELLAQDLCVAHISAYSSAPPGGCLRLAIFATHTPAQIDRLLAALASLLP
jgi:glycine C-acetyltransferase/8-amino-7-oxononanoate synthase